MGLWCCVFPYTTIEISFISSRVLRTCMSRADTQTTTTNTERTSTLTEQLEEIGTTQLYVHSLYTYPNDSDTFYVETYLPELTAELYLHVPNNWRAYQAAAAFLPRPDGTNVTKLTAPTRRRTPDRHVVEYVDGRVTHSDTNSGGLRAVTELPVQTVREEPREAYDSINPHSKKEIHPQHSSLADARQFLETTAKIQAFTRAASNTDREHTPYVTGTLTHIETIRETVNVFESPVTTSETSGGVCDSVQVTIDSNTGAIPSRNFITDCNGIDNIDQSTVFIVPSSETKHGVVTDDGVFAVMTEAQFAAHNTPDSDFGQYLLDLKRDGREVIRCVGSLTAAVALIVLVMNSGMFTAGLMRIGTLVFAYGVLFVEGARLLWRVVLLVFRSIRLVLRVGSRVGMRVVLRGVAGGSA